VSKGFAVSEWCAYKAAITERRIDPSVGTIARQSKVGRTGCGIHIGEGGLSSCHNIAVCLKGDGEGMCQNIAGERCCHAAMIPKAVIDRSVGVVAYQEEAGDAVVKHQVGRSNETAGRDDLGNASKVGRNDKSTCAVKGEPRSLAIDTEACNKTAIRSVEGRYAAGADQDVAIWQKRDRFA